jgi:translocation and assembly module TamB
MPHRSNQAVASQEQPAPQPETPQPARRFLIGWTTALAALGVSTAALAAALWLMRFPIAEFMLSAALAERGAEADFEIINLDLGHIVLRDVRFGAETAPDASIERVEATWRWAGLAPRLERVRVISPRLRVRLTREGRISLGALDRMRSAPSAERFAIPAIALNIEDGQARIVAPFGDLDAVFEGAGRLGVDFSGAGRIAETSHPGQAYALDRGSAELIVVSRENGIAFRLNADANELVWSGTRTRDAHIRIMGRAPLDLARYDVEGAWRIASLRDEDISANRISGAIGAEGIAQDNSINPQAWEAQLRVSAAAFTLLSNTFEHLRADARAEGNEERAEASWALAAQRFDGLSLISERPNANGALTVMLESGDVRGEAQLALSRSRLNAEAQQQIREAFPNLGDVPVGPTFARAEHALDAAADRFDLTIPLALTRAQENIRLFVAAPAQASAASGAQLRLSPLREDAPALVLQWPGPALHGAVALELSGGGAPDATLLLDTIDWAPNAPFEADGTLTLANWRADNASIAANELGVSFVVSPGGAGRLDLRGVAHITGPLGDGEVRDLAPDLDVAILWKPGWRVVPNRGCLPTRLGGLDAAGLSFGSGNFALCALNGALIAADANENLSGGFVIRQLALNGRMAGEAAQPARVTSSNITGIFSGRVGDMTLALQADAPRLAIDMGENRTLSLALQSLTANAHIADSWRVAGAFEAGTLSDPSLPGSVSTIAGTWNAAPEDGRPVIRVASGEALLTANRPATEDERLLFNPMRLTGVSAILRQGRVEANGQIVLQAEDQQLAAFTAWHEMDEGAGSAEIVAPRLTFSETLQPYQISERTRGLVENVRGDASGVATIAWSRDALTARGVANLFGVSFATTTLPIVQDVHGSVVFDDLFTLTTPPGQQVNVGLLNPGIAVHDGVVRFQLQPQQRVSIEHAVFQFAGGQLAMQPTTVTLGQDETRIVLTLSNVDAADLIASLNVPDLAATGRLEGTFPLLLTARTAFVENGELHALPGGGTLSYTGNAGQSATGVTRVAFDALRGFDYDALALRLNGDISGDVLTEIEFSGQNSGRAVDLGPVTPVPGLGNVSVRGVPFDFNVRITAPFRRLAQTAASITDPGTLINRATGNEDEDVDIDVQASPAPAPVDPEPPGTR